MNKRVKDHNMSYAELAKALLPLYDLDPLTCVLTNKTRGTTIQLREGGVVSTPFRSVSSQVFLYIMTHHVHPSEDTPEEYSNRMYNIKNRLHMVRPQIKYPHGFKQAKNPQTPRTRTKPKLTDKINMLKEALLAQDVRITALETLLNQTKP